MAFPETPVELLAEMQVGGVWTDITADLYARSPLTIERGRPDEATRVDPSKAGFQLDNRQNKYSPKNPRSANYGLIGRNTPVRFSLPGTESYLSIPAVLDVNASTPDHASLDITGDLDVRAEVTPASWLTTGSTGFWEVIGKYRTAGAQRSWLMMISQAGHAYLRWSADGTNLLFHESTVPVPAATSGARRQAIRATLDVNNGAGGYTLTFYTAPTMDDPWVQLGDAIVTTGGTTSIFAGTAPLELGDIGALGFLRVARRHHRAEVRSGIGGSVVAAPDIRALAPGTTSWTDSAGRLWTVGAGAEISDREYRLHAEVSSWPSRWDVSGQDVYVPVEASGILRRLGQGAKPLASTLRRRIASAGPVAYWPMEEGRDATQAYSPVPGCEPLPVVDFTFGADDSCPGSDTLPELGAAAIMAGPVPVYTTATGWYLSLVYQLDALPAGAQAWLAFRTAGTTAGVVVRVGPAVTAIEGYSAAGALLFNELLFNDATYGPGRWFRFDISAEQNGGTVDYHAGWLDVAGSGVIWDWSAAGTVGNVTRLESVFGPDFEGMKIGHVAVFPFSDQAVIWAGSDGGYSGETASARLLRLGQEEAVPMSTGLAATRMGPQRPDTLLSLLAQCEAADGGVLYEDRERLALRYRPRVSYYSQPVALTLDYAAAGEVAPPLEPVDDDQRTRNDRTVSRTGGSSARAVLESGSLSIQAPPAGVGIYDDTRTLNLFDDSQPQGIAEWLLHLGTWDEARYPTVHIDLAAAPHLIPAVLALDIGDRIQIINPPDWLPPGPIDLIVEGYTETIGHPYDWNIVLNCSPAGPWTVALADSTVSGRASGTGSVLGAAATSSATTLVVRTPQSEVPRTAPLWTEDPAQFPMELEVGGEVVTATGAAPLAADDFGRVVGAGGWGTASDGHAYTLTSGSASERSVSSGRGVITLTSTPTTARIQTLSQACQDTDIRVGISVSATATGAALAPAVVTRFVSASEHYRLRVHFNTGGTIGLSVCRVAVQVDAGETVPGLTYTPGAVIQVRVRLIGHRMLARAWATGTTEPITWHIDRTIVTSPITSGTVGMAGASLTGNTNVSPECRFDDFLAESPQLITVTRATNQVSKSHAAGAVIGLAQPAIAAL
ncbi:hypothetical protein ACWFQ8_29745 [Streptomyces sp. NPDC055254]